MNLHHHANVDETLMKNGKHSTAPNNLCAFKEKSRCDLFLHRFFLNKMIMFSMDLTLYTYDTHTTQFHHHNRRCSAQHKAQDGRKVACRGFLVV